MAEDETKQENPETKDDSDEDDVEGHKSMEQRPYPKSDEQGRPTPGRSEA